MTGLVWARCLTGSVFNGEDRLPAIVISAHPDVLSREFDLAARLDVIGVADGAKQALEGRGGLVSGVVASNAEAAVERLTSELERAGGRGAAALTALCPWFVEWQATGKTPSIRVRKLKLDADGNPTLAAR